MTDRTTYRIERLGPQHDRAAFDCGKGKLNVYIRTLAGQHDKRNIGRTFVAVEQGTARVWGFYTLASSAVAFERMPAEERLPRYPVPVIKLAQLAVDAAAQGKGLGEQLLMDALARAERVARDAAVFAVEVDVLEDDAIAFYTRYGFRQLKDDARHVYLSLKMIARLNLNG